MSLLDKLLPPAISRGASEVDALFWFLTIVCTLVAVGVVLTGIYFSVRYRRGAPRGRGPAPTRTRRIEYLWIGVPLAFFLFFFAWGASLYAYVVMLTSPPGAITIYVTAKQWMWKIQHENGRREIDTLHVPLGRPVRLVMSSEDVIHSFFLPDLRIKRDVLPGTYEQLWFKADRLGEYPILCAEYCGTDHSRMRARLVVMAPEQYAAWLEQGSRPALAEIGARRFRELGCSGCHGASSTIHAPYLQGIFGKPVHLSDGSTVTADELYIRDSILLPTKQIVIGYAPIMPSFTGQVSEEDLQALIEYIKVMKEEPR